MYDKENWQEEKRKERDATILKQKDLLSELAQDPKKLADYLIGRGRLGSQLTSGNAALVLHSIPSARAVMSYTGWKSYGRSVSKGKKGITVLTKQNGYLTTAQMFDISQTNGNKPYPYKDLSDEKAMDAALTAISKLSPVPVTVVEQGTHEVVYFPEQEEICYPKDMPKDEVFRKLPAVIVETYTELHTPGSADHELTKMYAAAVSLELCGRFGVEPDREATQHLANSPIEEGQEREVLEGIREMSRTFGNYIDKCVGQLEQNRSSVQRDNSR